MENKNEHVEKFCNIKDCKEEARYFLGDLYLYTFYLCQEHAEILTGEELESYNFVSPQGEIINKELAIYSCSEDCRVCNE